MGGGDVVLPKSKAKKVKSPGRPEVRNSGDEGAIDSAIKEAPVLKYGMRTKNQPFPT